MPKKPVDYSKTIIYKIVCKDLSIKDLYIGSTTDFTSRKCCHRRRCNNENNKKYNLKVYQTIRDNGGWDNFEMIEIEKYPCNDNNEARKIERNWYEKLHASMNTFRPFVSEEEKKEQKKEYISRPEVKEHRKKHLKEYESRTEVKERRKHYLKEYRSRPEVKEHTKKQKKEYHSRPEVKEKQKEQQKETYEKRKKEKTICSCGLEVRKDYLKSHERTKKHIKYVQSLNSLN